MGRGAVEAEQILPFLYRRERKSDWACRVPFLLLTEMVFMRIIVL